MSKLHMAAWGDGPEVIFKGGIWEIPGIFSGDVTRHFGIFESVWVGGKSYPIDLSEIDIWYECVCNGCTDRATQNRVHNAMLEFCDACSNNRCDAYPGTCPAIHAKVEQ
jgi:hypothetical protein